MSNNNYFFRVATYNDKNQIAKVLIDFYNMNDLNEASNVFVDELKKDFHYIVAIENGEIIGLVSWLTHGLPKHGLFELDRICILSKARGMGIGKKLIDELKNDASKWYKKMNGYARKLYLLTHENNTNAHIFYKRVGFTHETTLKDHYYKDQNERVYSMFLL
tara:strand:- start:806 stop:1291 length:486 start_codon:yes stop_codon:yes gene_type:complete